MKNFTTLLRILLFALMINSTNAQSGTTVSINGNQINAIIRNDGLLFIDDKDYGNFKVPFNGTNSPSSILYSSIMLLGVKENNELLFIGDQYSSRFIPGPLYDDVYQPTADDTKNFDKIWTVDEAAIRAHIKDFNDDGKVDQKRPAIYSWPGRGNPHFKKYNNFDLKINSNTQYAPFHDQNLDGRYDPDFGDYPIVEGLDSKIIPAVISWTIYHSSNNNFRMEISQTAWQLACENTSILNRTLFVSYKISSKNNFNLKELYICNFNDGDLGCSEDDYFGSIPEKNAAFWYNADSADGDSLNRCSFGVDTYKGNPPCQSVVLLNNKLSASVTEDLKTHTLFGSQEYLNYFKGMPGGMNIINKVTGLPTSFQFSDNPNDPFGWSMFTSKVNPSDYSVYNTTKLDNIGYQSNSRFDLAFIFHHQPGLNYLQNVNLAYQEIDEVQGIYNSRGSSVSCVANDCVNDCVWTGDTDNDGLVSYLDAVNIFKAFGQTGSLRKNVWQWKGNFADNWSDNFPNNLNSKFADANGDGMVDDADLEAVTIYNNYTHNQVNVPQDVCLDANDFVWSFITKDSVLGKPLILGLSLNSPLQRIQGLSFEIWYDADIMNIKEFGAGSFWQDNNIKVKKYIENPLDSTGTNRIKEVYFTSTTNDEITRTGTNLTYLISSNKVDSLLGNYSDINLCNAKAYLKDGTIRQLGSKKLRIYKNGFVAVSDHKKTSLELFPQPADNKIYFSQPELVRGFELYSVSGVRVLQTMNLNSDQSIDISQLVSGSYFAKVKLLNGYETFKVVIIK